MGSEPKTPKRKGRPKGAVSVMSHDLRAMVLKALTMVGGVEFLAQQAERNPVAILSLLARLIPREIVADVTHHQSAEDVPDAVLADIVRERGGRAIEAPPGPELPH